MRDQLTIIEIEAREDGGHGLQSQSGRKECWLEGWVAVPEELVDTVWDCKGYCELDIRDGVLVGVVPGEAPEPEPVPYVPTLEEEMAAAILEGVNEV